MRNHFKVFNLENHGNETYGLKSLSADGIGSLNKVIRHYYQLPTSYPYNNGKSAIKYLDELKAVAASGDKYKCFKIKREISEHKRLRMLQDWYEHQAASLDDEHFWRKLAAQHDATCCRALQKLQQHLIMVLLKMMNLTWILMLLQ